MPDSTPHLPIDTPAKPLKLGILKSHLARHAPVVVRILAASLGGYALAALFSIAVLALPGAAADKVLWGMMGSFLVWVLVVLWTFAGHSTLKALTGLAGAAVVLGTLAAWATRAV